VGDFGLSVFTESEPIRDLGKLLLGRTNLLQQTELVERGAQLVHVASQWFVSRCHADPPHP
jgi:hypothetical protein